MTTALFVLLGVGIFMGLVLGRDTERVRRSYKDWQAAKATVRTGRVLMWTAMRGALYTFLGFAGALVLALIMGYQLPL